MDFLTCKLNVASANPRAKAIRIGKMVVVPAFKKKKLSGGVENIGRRGAGVFFTIVHIFY